VIKKMLPTFMLSACLISGSAVADALTQIIQRDLVTLGYDPGSTDGEATVATASAISKFQSENGLEVTGEASPQLAGIIKAALSGNAPATPATPAAQPSAPVQAAPQAAAVPAGNALDLQAAQQACLQQKVAERQESEQRKRGFARLARAVTRTASRLGGDGISREVSELSSTVYDVNAITGDLKGAAEDLGLTESDIEECRNPS
jgi:peptidoglycan hydrolase-like protein with peptidoglycan-binding domain